MSPYPIFVGIFIALVMVAVSPNPVWWIVAALGAGANGVAVAANGWKMPVRGKVDESIRHVPMTEHTRRKWLADIIPVGFGKASVGDFFIAAGIMGAWATRSQFSLAAVATLAVLAWWGSGWTRGFGLFSKWPAEARRDARKNIPIVLVLMLIGNLVNIRGCTIGELKASTKDIAVAIKPIPNVEAKPQPESKYRFLGELAPPPSQVLTRLHREEAEREAKRQADIVVTKRQIANDATAKFFLNALNTVMVPVESRKGPFCHVTCVGHHGQMWDRETLPEYCTANWIPPNLASMPGWDNFGKYDATTFRPGPAMAGFEKYQLYWKNERTTR